MNRRLGILTSLLVGTWAWAQGRTAQAKTGNEGTAAKVWSAIVIDVCKATDGCHKVNEANLRVGPGTRSIPRIELDLVIAGLALLQKYYPISITAAVDEARFKAQQPRRAATK